jgi:hypothetical protein
MLQARKVLEKFDLLPMLLPGCPPRLALGLC